MNEWLYIPVVLSALAILIVGLKIFDKKKAIHPEVLRKALHVGMGCICISFPWLFHAIAPVLALSACAILTLLGLKFLPALRNSFGETLHGVERLSLGEFYFIAGVAGLFVLAKNNPGLFVLPMLWLTFADATAALIGVKYGTIRYETYDGRKSIEGSTAFAVVAYITTFMGLVAMGHVDVFTDTLIAAIIGILIMLLEALAWNGIDNFLIPIFGFAIFQNLLSENTTGLVLRTVVLAGLFALTHWKYRRTSLGDDALLGAVISGYAFWVLGGWPWLIAPFLVFIKDKIQSSENNEERRHNIHAVMAICAPGLACVLGTHIYPEPEWLLASTVAFAIHYALFHQMKMTNEKRIHPVTIELLSAGRAILSIGGTYVAYLLITHSEMNLRALLVGAVLVFLSTEIFRRIQPGLENCPRDTPRWIRQSGVSALGALIIVLLPWVF